MASRFSVRATVLASSMVLVSIGVVLTDPGCYSGGPLGNNGKGGGGGGDGGNGVGPDGQVLTDAGLDAPHYFDGSMVQQCPLTFSVDTPYTYVAKVKNILVGLPPTEADMAAVTGAANADAGAAAFAGLVNTWMTSTTEPAGVTGGYAALYATKMMRFFELAFQQTQIATVDFENMLNAGQLTFDSNKLTVGLMLQNHQEVFARTMLQLDQMGQPFNTAMTTTQFMLTPAMKAYYALLDDWQLNDSLQGVSDSVGKAGLMPTVTVTKAGTNDPANGEFVDPNMTFSTGCTKLSYSPSGQKFISNTLWRMLVGEYEADDNGCTATTTGTGQFLPADFTDWQLVTLSQPSSGTAPPFPFWVMSNFRKSGANYTSITLNRPYVGFFTTPAFFANWQTNASNQDRVTVNQSVIVATQQMYFNDPTTPVYDPLKYGLDNDHMGDSGTSPCYFCHRILDPTRQVFARNLSWYYGSGLETADTGAGPAYFASWDAQAPMSTLNDFGAILSKHPLFASAWPQKLCYYVNSGSCDLTDPEFLRIQAAFQKSSSFSWSQLVADIVTSPITTHTAQTQSVIGTASGPGNCQPVAVSRRDHLCAALNARLGFQDICGVNSSVTPVISKAALNIVPGLPSDGYGRGSLVPVLPNAPSLFYRTGTENFCAYLAQLVVDNTNTPPGAMTFSSSGCVADSTSCGPIGTGCTEVDAGAGMTCTTPGDFVTVVAGLPSSDPRASLLAGALMGHFNDAMASKLDGGKKVTATDALESAFIAACISPSAVSIGL